VSIDEMFRDRTLNFLLYSTKYPNAMLKYFDFAVHDVILYFPFPGVTHLSFD
jgi:hypothetical protein